MPSMRAPASPPASEADTLDDALLAAASGLTATLSEQRAEGRAETIEASVPGAVLETAKFVERGLLGRGGSSVVVRAFDKDLLRDVAVKVLLNEFPEASRETERFTEEAR